MSFATNWILGRSVEAEVVDLWLNQTNEAAEGELTFEYYVRYRFTTSNGRTITRDSPVSGIELHGSQSSSPKMKGGPHPGPLLS